MESRDYKQCLNLLPVSHEAVIVYTLAFMKIKEEFESFRNFIDNLDKSENFKFVKKELAKRSSRMGPKSAMIYLYSIGENVNHEE